MPAQRSRFHDVDWQEVLDRLTAYAVKLLASAGLLGSEAVVRGVGKSAEDLAAETVMKVLTEQGVKYRSSKGPLIPFLAKVMLNDFKDLLRQSAYKTAVDPPVAEGSEPKSVPRASQLTARTNDPFFFTLEREQKQRIRCALGNVDDLRDVVDAVMEMDCQKPSEIAQMLDISPKEVQNRKKRLRRRLAELYVLRDKAPRWEA